MKTSLLGSTAAMVSDKMNAIAPFQTPVPERMTDSVPVRKGRSVLGLRCKPLKTVRIGVVGLGRGRGAVTRLSQIEGTEIIALCDLIPERLSAGSKCI